MQSAVQQHDNSLEAGPHGMSELMAAGRPALTDRARAKRRATRHPGCCPSGHAVTGLSRPRGKCSRPNGTTRSDKRQG